MCPKLHAIPLCHCWVHDMGSWHPPTTLWAQRQTSIPSKGTFRFSAHGTDRLWDPPRGLIPRRCSVLVREVPRSSVYNEMMITSVKIIGLSLEVSLAALNISNGPNATTKNYDSLETWRKEKTRPSPENLQRWNIYSHEWKRSENGRMEQSKAMEYESLKASSDF